MRFLRLRLGLTVVVGLTAATLAFGAPARLEGGSGSTATATGAPVVAAARAELVAAGKIVFFGNCAPCHADDRSGGYGPALNSEGFLKRYGLMESDLAAFIRKNMPQDDPGRLTDAQAATVAAYLLDAGRADKQTTVGAPH